MVRGQLQRSTRHLIALLPDWKSEAVRFPSMAMSEICGSPIGSKALCPDSISMPAKYPRYCRSDHRLCLYVLCRAPCGSRNIQVAASSESWTGSKIKNFPSILGRIINNDHAILRAERVTREARNQSYRAVHGTKDTAVCPFGDVAA